MVDTLVDQARQATILPFHLFLLEYQAIVLLNLIRSLSLSF